MGKRSTVAVIYDPFKDIILLHLRDEYAPTQKNMWAGFGGGQEENESILDCLYRELREELGLVVSSACVLYIERFLDENDNEDVCYVVLLKKDSQRLVLNEGAGMEWMSIHNAIDLATLAKSTRDTIKTFLGRLNAETRNEFQHILECEGF